MSTFEEIKTGNPAHQGWPYSEAVRAGDFIITHQSGLWPGLLIEVECTAYQPVQKGP